MTGIEPAVFAGFMALAGLAAMFWKIYTGLDGKITGAVNPVREKAQKACDDLNSFKLEVAQKYTTKEDVAQAIKPVLTSVEGVKTSVDNMTARVDRILEMSHSAKPVQRRATAQK